MNRRLLLALLLIALCACGPSEEDPTPDADAGVAPDADSGLDIAPPNIDWLEVGMPPIAPPAFTPCPDGWREAVDTGGPEADEPPTVTCEAYPVGGPEACGDGSAHFLGEPGCTPIGAPCPVGDFPEGLPSDRTVLYVLSGAAPGGDGSPSAPLATIADAMALTSPGTIIALGKGVYDEAVHMQTGVTLWGACAQETRLTTSGEGPLARGAVTVLTADTQLTNLRLGPAGRIGLSVFGEGSSVAVEGVVIEAARSVGIFADQGGRVHGHTVAVFDTRSSSSGAAGRGIHANAGGVVELTRVIVAGSRSAGVRANGLRTSITLSDLVIRDTQGQDSDRGLGEGLLVAEGAQVQISRALLERNHKMGVLVHGEGTSVTLSDVVVRDTESQQVDGAFGRGLGIEGGATAVLSRVLFANNREIGVFATHTGTSITISDLVVRDTRGRGSDGAVGRGLNVQEGATADISRVVFARNREVGVFARDNGTSMTIADLVVSDTQGQESDGEGGRGLNVQGGATATVARMLATRNRKVGVFASAEGTSLVLSDVVVRETDAQESDGEGGRGVAVGYGASVQISRAVVSNNRDVGVLSMGRGANTQLTDIVIRETAAQRCGETTCADRPYGVGLATALFATTSATRFTVAASALCGVLLMDGAEVDLSAGHVSHALVGVCLQVDGYPLARLTEQVRYTDNGTNIDATRLPVPEAGTPIDGSR